jgi:hypothetical protein
VRGDPPSHSPDPARISEALSAFMHNDSITGIVSIRGKCANTVNVVLRGNSSKTGLLFMSLMTALTVLSLLTSKEMRVYASGT